jgi:hypothetical protein
MTEQTKKGDPKADLAGMRPGLIRRPATARDRGKTLRLPAILRERVAVEPPQCREGGGSGGEDPGASQGQADGDGGDCGGDGGETVDDQREVAAPAPAGPGRPRSRRRVGRDWLTEAEIADLIAPTPVASVPWVRPLSATPDRALRLSARHGPSPPHDGPGLAKTALANGGRPRGERGGGPGCEFSNADSGARRYVTHL